MSSSTSQFVPSQRRSSPARAQRRRLAADVAIAAMLAAIFLLAANGLGVVAWFALPLLGLGLLSLAVEAFVRRRRARRRHLS